MRSALAIYAVILLACVCEGKGIGKSLAARVRSTTSEQKGLTVDLNQRSDGFALVAVEESGTGGHKGRFRKHAVLEPSGPGALHQAGLDDAASESAWEDGAKWKETRADAEGEEGEAAATARVPGAVTYRDDARAFPEGKARNVVPKPPPRAKPAAPPPPPKPAPPAPRPPPAKAAAPSAPAPAPRLVYLYSCDILKLAMELALRAARAALIGGLGGQEYGKLVCAGDTPFDGELDARLGGSRKPPGLLQKLRLSGTYEKPKEPGTWGLLSAEVEASLPPAIPNPLLAAATPPGGGSGLAAEQAAEQARKCAERGMRPRPAGSRKPDKFTPAKAAFAGGYMAATMAANDMARIIRSAPAPNVDIDAVIAKLAGLRVVASAKSRLPGAEGRLYRYVLMRMEKARGAAVGLWNYFGDADKPPLIQVLLAKDEEFSSIDKAIKLKFQDVDDCVPVEKKKGLFK